MTHLAFRIQGLLRALEQIIRAQEEEHYVESSEQPKAHFNIMTDLRYHKMKLCMDEVVIWSSNVGLGKQCFKTMF